MPYALEFEVPGNEALYERVKSEIGDEQPAGLLVHMVVKTSRGCVTSRWTASKSTSASTESVPSRQYTPCCSRSV